jgi:hypothetical protein
MGFVKQPNGKLGSWIVTLADRMLLRLTSRVSGRSFLDTDPIFKTGKLSLCSSKCRKNQPVSKNRLINQSLIFAKLVSLRDSNGMAAQTHAWRELPFFFSPFNNSQKSSPISPDCIPDDHRASWSRDLHAPLLTAHPPGWRHCRAPWL